MTSGFLSWASPRLALVEPRLATTFAQVEPAAFREACRYPLLTGGKRVRPLLCLAAAESVREPGAELADEVYAAAIAVELLHTYSLVHDDLPAMDDDAVRRGRPTCHVVYGEATAILVGDALLTESFAYLAGLPGCVAELARAAGAVGMVGGQYLDIHRLAGSFDELRNLHAKKTGALIRAAARMGGIAAGANAVWVDRLGEFGERVGLAFQVHDDVLDAAQDAGEKGPPSYVRLLGLQGAVAEAQRLAAAAELLAAEFPNPAPLVALARFTVERGE